MDSRRNRISVKEITVFGLLGALMYVLKFAMQALPNIHLLGVMIVAATVVYRAKALYPLYLYVLLEGLFSGFGSWWLPYVYIWTVLWAAVMLLPKDLPPKAAPFIYAGVCGLHGFTYGLLYAPAQALLYGMNFKGTIAWIVAGFPFDAIHGASNLVCGFVLIVPLIRLLKKL